MSPLGRELFHAIRRLRRRPRFTASAILLLAFGIGATSAIFGLVQRVLVRPLPFPESGSLVRLQVQSRWDGVDQTSDWSFPWYQDLKQAQSSFSELSAHQSLDVNLLGGDQPERVRIEMVSSSYFPLLGLRPALGRLFTAEESSSGGAPVVVLGNGLWHRRWSGSPDVLGKKVRVNDTVCTVVGVLSEGYRGLGGDIDAWVPLQLSPALFYDQALEAPWYLWLQVLGRLRDGVDPGQADRELGALVPRIAGAYPLPMKAEVSWGGRALPLRDTLTAPQMRVAIFVLLGAVGFILLIACANLANLMLARASERRRELAVRACMGACRWTLLREAAWESLLVTVAGGALGLALASGALKVSRLLYREVPSGEGSLQGVFGPSLFTLDYRVVAIGLGLTLLVALLAAIVPGWRAFRADLTASLRPGLGAAGGRGRSRRWVPTGHAVLLMSEVGVALILLLGAALMGRSMAGLLAVDGGFQGDHVLTFRFEPPRSEYATGTQLAELYRRLWERLRAVPGVEGVSFDQCAPFSGACDSILVTNLNGREPGSINEAPQLQVHYVSPDHFTLLRTDLISGRGFLPSDRAGTPPVLLVNRAAARRLFDAVDPLGKRLALANGLFSEPGATAAVVGEVGDIHYGRPTDTVEPAVYVSTLQFGTSQTIALVRTSGDPLKLVPSLRSALADVDPNLPTFDLRPLTDRVSDAFSRPQATTWLLAIFALVASALALMGMYAVVSYTVSCSTREFGLRLALGSSHQELLRLVMGRTGGALCIGLAAGAAGAAALSKGLASLLYGVSVFDPTTWVLAIVGLTVAALVAAFVPARRAARIDPLESLRGD